MKKIILSQNFASLGAFLALVFRSLLREDFSIQKQWIFVPSHSLKQWLLLQIARANPKGGVLGFQISTLEERLRVLCPKIPTQFELSCLLDQALTPEKFPEIGPFLSKSPQNRKMLREQLTQLCFTYVWNGFIPKDGWQARLFQELEIETWMENIPIEKETIHLFGFDFFPQTFFQWISTHQSCFVYLFSPCALFWEDVCTEKERGRLLEFWYKKNVPFSELHQLEEYLIEAPLLLANWGKLGRETLKQFDDWDMESAHSLSFFNETSLHQLQREILSFEKKPRNNDQSIRVVKAGMTKHEEVVWLCSEIERLQHTDILILAPDIAPYIPWIELLFSQRNIPYRFSSVSVERKSPFFRGLSCLMAIAEQGFSFETLDALFETSSFSRKFRLKGKQWRSWLEEVFQISSDWKQGIPVLLDRFLIVTEGPKTETFSFGELDSFEEWLLFLQSLETDVALLQEEKKTLSAWASTWELIAEKYLYCDSSDEADSFCQSAWERRMIECKKGEKRVGSSLHSLDVVKKLFFKPIFRPIHGNHLHAISCASIEIGAIVPAKTIFVLGMDEESFPRKSTSSSLNLLSTYAPEAPDQDRYLLLQIVMNAKESLYFSYLDKSPEDGRSVPPSFLIQELCTDQGIAAETLVKEEHSIPLKKTLQFGSRDTFKMEEIDVSISQLALFAKHPWKYYLQNVLHISLPRENRRSIAKERGSLLRTSLQFPLKTVTENFSEKWPGLLHEAFVSDVQLRENKRQSQLKEWGKEIFSISLSETGGVEPREFSPLKIELDNGAVVKITGTIFASVEKGSLHLGDDTISSMFQNWPEILISSCVLNSSEVYLLKSGKVKKIEDPKRALQRFLTYYLRCKEGLSPLIGDWVDPLLRKSPEDFQDTFRYEDEVHRFVQHRLDLPEPNSLFSEWSWLRPIFSDLIALYPGRSVETV